MDELRYQLDLLKAMNQKLIKQEKMYRMVVEATDGTYLYYNEDNGEFAVFGQWDDFFDFKIQEAKDFLKIYDQFEAPYEEKLKIALFPERNNKDYDTVECQSKDRKRWFQFNTHVVYKDGPAGIGKCNISDKIILIRDITKYKMQNDELTYFAYYDNATGLYNRNYFVRLLSEMLKKAKNSSDVVSVIMIDIDDFHKINDGLGMLEGDELVQQLALVLKDMTTSDGRVIACHFNSDVYCMAIYSPDSTMNADTIFQNVQKRIKSPFMLGNNQEVYITASFGVAEYPEAAQVATELINCSEIVMLRCKSKGKNGIMYFDTPILNDFFDNLEIENKLKDAVFSKNFEIYYQPQFYSNTKELRGFEALIRWKDLDGRYISPVLFIPIAEKNGSIISIGNWVVEESIKQYAQWKAQYGIKKILSINISARQYAQEHFVDHFLDTIYKYNIDPNEIEIEVTESLLIDDFDGVTRKLQLLKDRGIRISLDDFGTGFSSLSYLKRLPIDTLKIDKSFIDTVLTDHTTRIITESIVDMVKSLGFDSISEGVEEEQQYQYLHAIGCDVIQGYFFSRPLPPVEIEKLF